MRYESFYPFARNQTPPPFGRQQSPGFNPFAAPPQNLGQPNPPNLFQGQPPGQPAPGGGPSSGPGPGPSKIDAYMNTANQFMNTAQQFAPVVQQFAPMMRNLPAMWRLYKGFQSIPPTGGPSAGAGIARAAAQSPAPNLGPQPSIPRIFQPPS